MALHEEKPVRVVDGPNFFCFISPKAHVNKSMAVKHNNQDQQANKPEYEASLDTCLLYDNDSLSCQPAINQS